MKLSSGAPFSEPYDAEKPVPGRNRKAGAIARRRAPYEDRPISLLRSQPDSVSIMITIRTISTM